MLLYASLMTLGMAMSWLPISAATNTTMLGLSDQFTLFSWPSTNDDVTLVDQSFAFQLDKSAVLQLIDYKQPGDVFHLFDNGHSLGKTIRPKTMDEDLYAETPELALADAHQRFSKGQALLAKGDHFITIKVLKSNSANVDAPGGGIRLIDAPMKLQQFYKDGHDDDDDDDEYEKDDDYDDDDDKDDDYDKDDDDDDYDHKDYHKDKYDYTMTLTVVVPPTTPDLWRHRTEPMVTMMPAPAGNQARGGFLPVAAQIRGGLQPVTFIPPAGRATRNPMAGGGRR